MKCRTFSELFQQTDEILIAYVVKSKAAMGSTAVARSPNLL